MDGVQKRHDGKTLEWRGLPPAPGIATQPSTRRGGLRRRIYAAAGLARPKRRREPACAREIAGWLARAGDRYPPAPFRGSRPIPPQRHTREPDSSRGNEPRSSLLRFASCVLRVPRLLSWLRPPWPRRPEQLLRPALLCHLLRTQAEAPRARLTSAVGAPLLTRPEIPLHARLSRRRPPIRRHFVSYLQHPPGSPSLATPHGEADCSEGQS